MFNLSPPEKISLAITLIIAITVHEFAHAYTADRLGDPTPGNQGRLTLNPLMHLDPIGSIVFILIGFGWGRPVMTNPYNLRFNGSPRLGMAIVAVAGPFSNLALALLAAIPLRLGLLQYVPFGGVPGLIPSVAEFWGTFIFANLALLLFNLLPISPLDGFKVAVGTLPFEWSERLARLEPYGPIILLALLILPFSPLGIIMGPPLNALFRLITGQ